MIITLILFIMFPLSSYAKFKVAVLLPASGPSFSSTCVIQQVALKNKNLIVETFDSGNTIPDVINGARKAASLGFEYIIGPRTSQEVIAALNTIRDNKKIITIVPMASHPSITKNFSNTIRKQSHLKPCKQFN